MPGAVDPIRLAEVLALALGLSSVATTALALRACSKWVAQYRSAAREATTRSVLAETPLAAERQKRSAAVSKGNRTRAATQADKVRTKTAEIRDAVELKKIPPQAALLLDPLPPIEGMQ